MKIQFNKQANAKIIADIQNAMEGRSLGDLVSIGEESGGLIVKITKLGTSTLHFERQDHAELATFTLTTEKIAFAHKAFKEEVKSKLLHIIEKAGGKILESTK